MLAEYSGDATNAASLSAAVVETVNSAPSGGGGASRGGGSFCVDRSMRGTAARAVAGSSRLER